MGSESHLRRGRRQEASWEPLGALLEALGAEKSNWGAALGRPRGASGRDFTLGGGQKGSPAARGVPHRPRVLEGLGALRPKKHCKL